MRAIVGTSFEIASLLVFAAMVAVWAAALNPSAL
jgi:hypothetical protein